MLRVRYCGDATLDPRLFSISAFPPCFRVIRVFRGHIHRLHSCHFVFICVPPTRCSLPPSGSSQLSVFLPIRTRELINETVIQTKSSSLEETETKAFVEAVRADI